MSSVQYEYNRFEFDRDPLDPMTEAEYKAVLADYDGFVHGYLDEAEAAFAKLKNPHAFNWKVFTVLLLIGAAFVGADYTLKALGNYDGGELCAMISAIPFLAVIVQPIQWLLSFSKSSSFRNFEDDCRNYFEFHKEKASASSDYSNYRMLVARTNPGEYKRFTWDEQPELVEEPAGEMAD